MKMTHENWGRSVMTTWFLAVTIYTAVTHRVGPHIFFAVCALLLSARVVYCFVKGK